MNAENTSKSKCKLEQLTAEQLEWLYELSKKGTLGDIVEALRAEGIATSDSALSRFFKKRRGQELVENGKDLAGTAEALAEQGRGGKLREGTLEVLRQNFFEKAAEGQLPEDAREVYGALVEEEERVKRLELEARKVAALEQQVRLQERRIEVEAMKARAALGRVKGTVVETAVKEGDGVALIGEGEPPEGGTPCRPESGGRSEAEGGVTGDPRGRFLELVKRAAGILNRGGDLGERIIESRALLAEALQGLGVDG